MKRAHSIALAVALALAVGGGVASALVTAPHSAASGAETLAPRSCRDRCYKRKSEAYQACRRLPPADRGARNACFRRADVALQACLNRCRRPAQPKRPIPPPG